MVVMFCRLKLLECLVCVLSVISEEHVLLRRCVCKMFDEILPF
jgi:hypothetical protein